MVGCAVVLATAGQYPLTGRMDTNLPPGSVRPALSAARLQEIRQQAAGLTYQPTKAAAEDLLGELDRIYALLAQVAPDPASGRVLGALSAGEPDAADLEAAARGIVSYMKANRIGDDHPDTPVNAAEPDGQKVWEMFVPEAAVVLAALRRRGWTKGDAGAAAG